jgi:DNA-binding CsgD family transcriptional regulator
VILGRAKEVGRVDALLDAARGGRGGALMVRGGPGIGKTRLLSYASEHAPDFEVLQAHGVDVEREFGYGGLGELLRPVLATLERLSEHERSALEIALGSSSQPFVDHFAVSAATVTLLSLAAEERPLLCLVDDVQWLDDASAQALVFAARRLSQDRVALLLAATDDGDQVQTGGMPELTLSGLHGDDARALAAASGVTVSREVTDRLIEATGGNPLALLEIPGSLTPEQREGAEPLDDPLVAGERIIAAFRHRVDHLSPQARRALLVVAADDRGDLTTLLRVRGVTVEALDEADDAGLLRAVGGRVSFRYPLMRSAVYSAAPGGARRAAHRALAEAARDSDPDRATLQLALAAPGPDEGVAAALETAAQRNRPRCRVVETDLLERAASLSSEDEDRARRLLLAGRAANLGGEVDRALSLVRSGLDLPVRPHLRAEMLEVLMSVSRAGGDPSEHVGSCLEMADDLGPTDPLRAAALLAQVWFWEQRMLHAEVGAQLESRVRVLLASAGLTAPPTIPRAVLAAGCFQALLDGAREVALALALHAADIEAGQPTEHTAIVAGCLVVLGDLETPRRLLDPALLRVRTSGAAGELVQDLIALSGLEVAAGRLWHAAAAAHEAVALASELALGPVEAAGVARAAQVEAARGNVEVCGALVRRARMLGQRFDDAWAIATADAAEGAVELASGRPTAAVRLLEQAVAALPGLTASPHLADLVESYVEAGRLDDARDLLDQLTGPSGLRCRALLAETGWEGAYALAVDAARIDGSQLDLGRARLRYGERLRRAGRRREARDSLTAARDLLDRTGASAWCRRAERELAGAGAAATAGDRPADLGALTPQELQVALLVAGGATNREAAGTLFLSPKTVELHLGRVYRKLGVRSRTELARRLPG